MLVVQNISIYFQKCMDGERHFIFEDQKGCIRGCQEFEHLIVKIDRDDRHVNDTKKRINNFEWCAVERTSYKKYKYIAQN